MRPQRPSLLRRLLPYFIVLFVLLILLANFQNIYDWFRLRNYSPPAEITALADQTTMTDSAKHLLYINHTQIQDRDEFNASCPNNGGEQTIILGCYHARQTGIFVFKVTDPQLDGVEQVTVAHEVLHAAYERFSSSEKKKIDAMLQDYYDNQLQDKRIKDTIDAYRTSEPNDLVNEMHSIFGSEIANLPPLLEAHYQKYFKNRSVVAAYAAKYQSAFTSRKDQIAAYDAQLKALKETIEQSEADLQRQSSELNAKRQELDNLLSSGNTEAYNGGVEAFNANIKAYNARVVSVKAQIIEYNKTVEARNALATEEQNLALQLNSRLQTQAAQ